MTAMPLPSTTTAPSTGCRLVAADGRSLPLKETTLRADARGGLARVVVEQRFANPHAEPLSLTYLLPLPADGAVVDFAFRLGERRIQGQVDRKASARQRFEEAVLEGRTAALLEQDRSSLFTQELGNVPPGAEVVAEITVEQPLSWREGGWEWRFPTTVAPRFLGEPGRTPDADRVTVDVADGPLPVRCHLDLRIGDALTGAVGSPSHLITARDGLIRLDQSAQLDRDLVVRWPVSTPQPGVCLEVSQPEGHDHAYGLLTVVPPETARPEEAVPRDLILLIDTSGSMGGAPLRQAVTLCRALVQGLSERDQLEMIEFSARPKRWQGAPVAMDARSRRQALAWLDGLRARSSTEMHTAIVEALAPLRPEAQRQVVLVTDGLIGFESQVIGAVMGDLPPSSRVHTVGVGGSVNRSLLGPVARAGAGLELIIGIDEPVEPAVASILERTQLPWVVDLQVSGEALREVAPARCPDLFAASPARLSLRLRPEGGPLVLSGRTAAGPWRQELVVPAAEAGRRVVCTRYAREKVEDLELHAAAGESVLDPQIEALGLAHGIATRMTSWVAVSDEPTVDPEDPTRYQRIPHSLPHGMSAEGVGLRRAQPTWVAGAAAPAMPVSAPAMAPPPLMEMADECPAPMGTADDHFDAEVAAAPRRSRGRREAPAKAELKKRKGGLLSAVGRLFEPPAPNDTRKTLAPLPPLSLSARVVLHQGERLVLELELPEDLQWAPDRVLALVDGREVHLKTARPTTRTGSMSAGQVVRLALELPAGLALPQYVIVRGGRELLLTLEVG